MADWSHLHKDLLNLIAQCFETPFETMRFRSVCPSWRSAISPKYQRLPGRFPFLPNHGITDTTWGFHLSKRSIFRIDSPPAHSTTHSESWLIKIEEDASRRIQLSSPLSKFKFKPLPEGFPKVLDMLNFPVLELGQEYMLHYLNFWPLNNLLGDSSDLYKEKVAYKCLNYETNDFLLLTIHVSGKLAMLRLGDEKWIILPYLALPYDDVVLFKGEFYAVDNSGATVLVESEYKVTSIVGPVYGGDKKILMESGGELLMVDMYLTVDYEGNFGLGDDLPDTILREKTIGFKVFKLSGDERKSWIEVNNLGDTVLFLGENCSFSTSAKGLSGCKGNCIFFTDSCFCPSGEEYDVFKGSDIAIFDLTDESISPLADCPGYSKLFWPPPDWITSASEMHGHLDAPAL